MNRVLRACLGALIGVCTIWAAASETWAQGADYQRPGFGRRGVGQGDWIFVPRLLSVFQRPRPDYDPLGVRLGSWVLSPEVTATAAYDSNVFAEESNTNDDVIFAVTPAFRLRSDWNVHMLGVEGFVTGRKYVEEDSEDAIEGAGTVFGRLDITRDDTLFGSVTYNRFVVARDDPEDQGGSLTDVNRYAARVGYVHQFTRLTLNVDAEAQRLDYLDSADDDRDRNQLDLGARVTYALSPRISPFVDVGYQIQDFDHQFDDTGVDRDAVQYSADVGARILITDLLLGELSAGVEHRDCECSTNTTTTARVAGQLTWNPTLLTSVIARARRTEEATTQAGASTRTVTAAAVRVEHELLRNLLLFGEAGYRNDDFEDINRTDHRFTAGLGGEFLLDRNFSFFAEYDFEDRVSDGADAEFTRHGVLVGVRAQY